MLESILVSILEIIGVVFAFCIAIIIIVGALHALVEGMRYDLIQRKQDGRK